MDNLIDALSEILEWIVNLILFIPLAFYNWLTVGLVEVLEWIPVPDWLADAQLDGSAVPAGAMFFLDAFQVPLGIGVIVSAYGLRFLIRRIPIFG